MKIDCLFIDSHQSGTATKRTAAAAFDNDDQPSAKRAPAFSFQEITGDLFTSPDSLVNCISADLNMGKGIVVEFKRRYGGTFGRVQSLLHALTVTPVYFRDMQSFVGSI